MHPSWLLRLGKGGKRLLVIAIIIGIPGFVASNAFNFRNGGVISIINEQQLIQANNTLVGQINTFSTNGEACSNAVNQIKCAETNDGRLATQLTVFAQTMSSSNSDVNISQRVISNAGSAATHLAHLLRNVADAGPSRADYKNAANFTVINDAAQKVETTLDALRTALNNS